MEEKNLLQISSLYKEVGNCPKLIMVLQNKVPFSFLVTFFLSNALSHAYLMLNTKTLFILTFYINEVSGNLTLVKIQHKQMCCRS